MPRTRCRSVVVGAGRISMAMVVLREAGECLGTGVRTTACGWKGGSEGEFPYRAGGPARTWHLADSSVGCRGFNGPVPLPLLIRALRLWADGRPDGARPSMPTGAAGEGSGCQPRCTPRVDGGSVAAGCWPERRSSAKDPEMPHATQSLRGTATEGEMLIGTFAGPQPFRNVLASPATRLRKPTPATLWGAHHARPVEDRERTH